MNKNQTITEGDIQKALAKFLMEGGLIKHLPDEIVPLNTMVGSRWGMYESVIESSTVGSDSYL